MSDRAAIGEPTVEIIAPDWSRRSARIDQTPFLIGRGSGNHRRNSGMVPFGGLEEGAR
jgi:hypothetical protein